MNFCEGAKDMMANGILDGADAALDYHVGPGRMPVGLFKYNGSGTMMYSVDGFRSTAGVPVAHIRTIPSIRSMSAFISILLWNR